MKNIIESFENRSKGLTIKGRKIISNSLLCSKLYHCTSAFPLKNKDFSDIQKLIDNFTHKKKVMCDNRKYLPFRRAGLALPCLTSKHQATRLALLKNIILLKRDNKTIPGWAIILDKALAKSASILLKSCSLAQDTLIFNLLGNTSPNLALAASPLSWTTTLQFPTYFQMTTLVPNASKRIEIKCCT